MHTLCTHCAHIVIVHCDCWGYSLLLCNVGISKQQICHLDQFELIQEKNVDFFYSFCDVALALFPITTAGTTAGAAGIRHPPSSFHVYADHLFPRLDQALFLPRKDTDPKHRSSVSRRQSSQSTRRSFTGTDGGARAPASRRNSFRQQRTTDSVVPLPVREICFDGICVDGTCVDGTCVDGTCFDVLMVHVLMVHDDTCAAYFLYMMVVFFV